MKEPYAQYYHWIDSGEEMGEEYAEVMRKHIEGLAEQSRHDQSFANSFNQDDHPRMSQFTD